MSTNNPALDAEVAKWRNALEHNLQTKRARKKINKWHILRKIIKTFCIKEPFR